MNRVTVSPREEAINLQGENIKKILLVRALFRMGDSILATPAISLLRDNFPSATIDFVGPRIAKELYQNLPIDQCYEIHRSFPKVCWSYLVLLKCLRQEKYDLALDVSGSSAALGSFIVGFSGARFRAGLRGRWDRWFNIRMPRPATLNKYANLRELVAAMGLKSHPVFPQIILSPNEIASGRERLRSLTKGGDIPRVGMFLGGRKSKGKRWDKENFLELAMQLYASGMQPILFIGPEEQSLSHYFQKALYRRAPVLFEPEPRAFAALVANCHLFVACDSGPLHLACALGVRTVAIFLKNDFDRWGPPAELARIVHHEDAVLVDAVFAACCDELRRSPSAETHVAAGFDHVLPGAPSSKQRRVVPFG